MFLGDVKQKVMRKMLVFTEVAVVDCLWQLANSLAHVSILRMGTIKTIDKTVVCKAQKKRTAPILNLFEQEDVGCVHEVEGCVGAVLYRTKQVAGFNSLGMQRNVDHGYLNA